jgi:hypothetical protein
LEEFPDVRLEELPEDLPQQKTSWSCDRSDAESGTPTKAPYRMSHEELKEFKV